MTNSQLMDLIRESSSQYDTPDYFMGYGIPDFQLALDTALFIQDFQNTNFKLFPNPFINNVQIILPQGIDRAEVHIFNVLGKLVYEKEIFENADYINLDHLSGGMYLAKIITVNDFSKTFKLIKN